MVYTRYLILTFSRCGIENITIYLLKHAMSPPRPITN